MVGGVGVSLFLQVSLASKCLHSGIILFIHYIYSGRSHQLAPLIHGKEWSC